MGEAQRHKVEFKKPNTKENMLFEFPNKNSRRDKWIYGAKSQTNSCRWWRKMLHGKGHKAACWAAGRALGLDLGNGHTHVCMCPSSCILQICTFCGMEVIHSWWGVCSFLFFNGYALKKKTRAWFRSCCYFHAGQLWLGTFPASQGHHLSARG